MDTHGYRGEIEWKAVGTMASSVLQAVLLALLIVLILGACAWGVHRMVQAWRFVDRDDFITGLAIGVVEIVLALALVVTGSALAGIFVFLILPVIMSLYFQTGALTGVEYGHVVKRGLRVRTWTGPGQYLVARHTEVVKIMKIAHAISVPKPPDTPDESAKNAKGVTQSTKSKKADARTGKDAGVAKPEFMAISLDRIRVNVGVLAKYSLLPEGDEGSVEMLQNLANFGTADATRERIRPFVEQAIRDVIGHHNAMDAATRSREVIRAEIEVIVREMVSKLNIDLKALVLGEVIPEDDVRRHEIHMRELEELEKSMGVTGLAVHRINALEKAGVVVVPSDPSVLMAAGARPIPPSPV